MKYSTLAHEHFTYNLRDKELHLPVRYPRQHHGDRNQESFEDFKKEFGQRYVCVEGKRLAYQSDDHMVFIRPDEIVKYVIPWLERVQDQLERAKAPHRKVHEENRAASERKKNLAHDLIKPTSNNPTGRIVMEMPNSLVGKIHLYNAMLQLGLPKFVQLVRNAPLRTVCNIYTDCVHQFLATH
jgi:hypothetical protein